MNNKQKAILSGMILGDCFLQKTGEKNARIRLEHSEKQRDYLSWKGSQFPEFFQGKPKRLIRYNPVYKKTYSYVRWQSNASPEIGKYRKVFYPKGVKIIPEEFAHLFKDPLSLAIWFMDDGYYYQRDKVAYIYLSKLAENEMRTLLSTLKANFSLEPTFKLKKRGELVLGFNVKETKKLMTLIEKHIIPSMKYKLPSFDPLSTEA